MPTTASDIIATNRNLSTTYATLADSAAYEAKEHADRIIRGIEDIASGEFAFSPSDYPDLDGIDAPADFADGYSPPTLGMDAPTLLTPALPDLETEAPTPPDPLNLSGLFQLSPPSWNVPDLDVALPAIAPIVLPDAPTLSMPTEPEPTGDRLAAPGITTPDFSAEFNSVAPEAVDARAIMKEEYADRYPAMAQMVEDWFDGSLAKVNPEYHTALAALEEKIRAGLDGQAMTDGFEERLYERERSRVIGEKDALERSGADALAKRGFMLPGGALLGLLAQAQEQTSRNLSLAASNTHIERARMELQHVQFVMQTTASLRSAALSAAMQYVGQMITVNGQCLEYARAAATFAVESFNGALQLHDTALRVYTAEAEIYKVRLEAAFAQLRVFQAEVEAEKMLAEVDRTKIDLYRAKIDAQKSHIDIYLGKLQGIDAAMRAETLKVQVFESQVRAWVAQIQGKEAEYGAYRAAIEGDSAKVQAQGEVVRAFAAEVDAYRARIDAGRMQLQSVETYNKVLADTYTTRLSAYETEIRAESQRFGSSVEAYKARLSGYLGELDAYTKKSAALVDQDRMVLQGKIAEFTENMKAAIANAEIAVKALAVRSDIAIRGADMLKDISAAAVNANSALVAEVTEA